MTSGTGARSVPWATIYEDVGWHLAYEIVVGERRHMLLDAGTLADAKAEATELTGVPESQIRVES